MIDLLSSGSPDFTATVAAAAAARLEANKPKKKKKAAALPAIEGLMETSA